MKGNREIRDYLHDLAFHAEFLQRVTNGLSYAEFELDYEKQLAVTRGFEILGEASKNLPLDFRLEHPNIPWEKIIAMRNKLAHEYAEISLQILWETIATDLPDLTIKLKLIHSEYSA